MEMVRLVNSGTEATMSALRLARGFTGRDLTIKFEGCYHGHVDSLLVKAGSGMATLGIADTAGVPEAFAETTIALPFNSIAAVEKAFAERGDQDRGGDRRAGGRATWAACRRSPGFLEALRDLTARHGALLIFDEVMTGFRVALGGAQQRFGIRPDLTTLGKIIGGGLPMAAYGGRADIMKKIAPRGSGVSGGNAVGESAGGGGGARDAAVLGGASGGLRNARGARGAIDGLDAAGSHGESRGIDVHVLLHATVR